MRARAESGRLDARLVGLGVAVLVVSSLFDSLRGPLLPLLAERFSLGYARTALFMTAGTAGSMAVNLAALPLLERLGERAFLMLCLALQSAALLLAAGGQTFPVMAGAGALWGAGLSGLGMTSNLLVVRGSRPEVRGRAVSALHVFFGLSSVLPPLYLARSRAAGLSWEAILLLPLGLVAALAGAAWRLAPGRSAGEAAPGLGGLRRWSVLAPALGLSVYVVGEVLASTWMVSYLRWRGASLAGANRTLSLFFLGLGGSRVLYALAARPGSERAVITACPAAAAACLGLGLTGRSWALALAGFAMGPIFPTAVTALSLAHPARMRGVMSLVYVLFTAGLAAGHPLLGAMADRWSLQAAYRAPALCLLAALALLRAGLSAAPAEGLPHEPDLGAVAGDDDRPPVLSADPAAD